VTTAVFIGDEVTAAAFRLAGVATQAPKPSDVTRAFRDATRDADLVIITANYAQAIDEESLHAAIRGADPLILVVPDGGSRHWPKDLDARIERVLGIER